MAIGNLNLVMPLVFDTGSAGVTLNAESVFPTSIVDANGFKFNGKDSISYQGITITSLNVKKVYGTNSKDTTIEFGNIAYATMTLGDVNRSVRTERMPVLFFYRTTSNSKQVNGPSIFGVNVSDNATQLVTNNANATYLISSFKYLRYTNNLIAGFKLGEITLGGCDIGTTNNANGCLPKALLTIGLTSADESVYAMNSLNAINPQTVLTSQSGYPAYPNYTLFNPVVPNCTIINGSVMARELGESTQTKGRTGGASALRVERV